MNQLVALTRLVGLRRLREQTALNELTQREGDCRRGEQQVDAARKAIVQSLAMARAHEQEKRQSLAGRAVSTAEIAGLQAELDNMAAETVRLRKVEVEAQTALQAAEQVRDAARDRYRACQRAVTKLDRLAEQERKKVERLEEAYAESDLEERAIMAAASTADQGWA